MTVIEKLRESIDEIGIKEVARRASIASSTVSRIKSGEISPSLEVVQKISKAVGLQLELVQEKEFNPPRLIYAKRVLSELKEELKQFGVTHVAIFGSVARQEDRVDSDIDIYLEFDHKPPVKALLAAEGKIIESFGNTDVDIVNYLDSPRGQRLKKRIQKEGIRVF